MPNVKNVQELSVLEVASEMNRLMELGGRGKLGADDLVGGTFTISNIGSVSLINRKHVLLFFFTFLSVFGVLL